MSRVENPMADADRRARILTLLGVHGPGVDRLCAACVAGLPGITGAAVVVMTTLPASGTRFFSDDIGARLEESQFALGEGPCVDAFDGGRPVLVPDITDREYVLRWPAFSVAAVAAGASAIFAFPLQIGAIRIGVLDLYRDHPGVLEDGEIADALVFADTVTLLLLAEHHIDEADLVGESARFEHRAVIHQATGMVLAQTGGTITEAFDRLRARAYAEDRPLAEVAVDVVDRHLRFDQPVD
jgi:hypothetical protein